MVAIPDFSKLNEGDLFFFPECDLLFTGEAADGHLEFFPTSSPQQKVIDVPVNQTCSFYFGDKLHAQYLGCDGAWNEIPTQSVIDGIEVTPGWSKNQLQIRVSRYSECEKDISA